MVAKGVGLESPPDHKAYERPPDELDLPDKKKRANFWIRRPCDAGDLGIPVSSMVAVGRNDSSQVVADKHNYVEKSKIEPPRGGGGKDSDACRGQTDRSTGRNQDV
jgi:hypothetical protein